MLERGVKESKSSVPSKEYAGRRQNGYLLFAERGVLGPRHLVRAPTPICCKPGNSLIYELLCGRQHRSYP
jgi:hypothetical protein